MPDTLPTMTVGNASQPPQYNVGQCINFMGGRLFEYNGYALVDTTTSNVIVLRNRSDQPCTIPCPSDSLALSATDPAYVTHVSFYVPKVGDIQAYNSKPVVAGITLGTSTNVLKLAATVDADLTDAAVLGAVSGAAVSGAVPSGVPAGEAISLFDPFPGIEVASAVELKLFSATAASGSGAAGQNIRVSAAQKRILIPVRVCYYRKMRSPGLNDFNISDELRRIVDAL